MLLMLAACGGRTQYNQVGPDRSSTLRSGPPLPMDEVLLLEQAGVAPTDTMVRFAAREGRTIVMRHVPPDNAVFATLAIAPDTTSNGLVTVRLTQMPGRYGLTISSTPAWSAGATLTYSYAMHFQAPGGIAEHYLGPNLYEAALGIGRLLPDGRLDFIPTTRPAGDILRAKVAEPGQYAVAAPK